MKVYIMVDFEGVAGFIEWDDYSWDTPMGLEKRARMRKILTGEVNAAIEGALAGGAKEVLVWDAHGPENNCNNIYFEDLNPEAEVIIGWRGLPSFYPLLDKTFQAGMYIGGHAMEGTPRAVTPHTKHNLNGHDIGEVGMFMAMCGYFDVPTVFVGGDRATVDQVLELVPEMGHVKTKDAFGPYSAKTLVPKKAQQLIREGTEQSLKKLSNIPPWKPGLPYIFTFPDGEKMEGNDLFDLFNNRACKKYGIRFDIQELHPQSTIFAENVKKQLRYRYW